MSYVAEAVIVKKSTIERSDRFGNNVVQIDSVVRVYPPFVVAGEAEDVKRQLLFDYMKETGDTDVADFGVLLRPWE